MITVPEIIASAQAIKKFKRVTHNKLDVGQLPIYDIKAGDKALSYDPHNQGWYFAPTINCDVNADNNRDEQYTNRDRRCYTCGVFGIDDLQAFDDICKNLKDCNDRELLMITSGDYYDMFALIIKDIYEHNPKYYVSSLEQRYKIAVNTLINIAKGGFLYPSKKDAVKTLQVLINKTQNDEQLIDKSLAQSIFDADFQKQLKEILS
jgi:hypothetical protein